MPRLEGHLTNLVYDELNDQPSRPAVTSEKECENRYDLGLSKMCHYQRVRVIPIPGVSAPHISIFAHQGRLTFIILLAQESFHPFSYSLIVLESYIRISRVR